MAMRTIPGLTYPAPVAFPTVGFGGSYYDSPVFSLPSYGTRPAVLTWRFIDDYSRLVVNKSSTDGIAAGMTWATFIYLLALAPNQKRTSLFHTCLLGGVTLLLVHLMINIISAGTPGLSKYSPYILLVGPESVIFPARYIAVQAASLVTEILSYCCASVCLWLQAKGLMTSIQNRFPVLYCVILGYLVFSSMATFATQLICIVKTLVQIDQKPEYNAVADYLTWIYVYHTTFAVSVGSYALISMCSIVSIIWRRPYSLVKTHNAYASALNLVGLLCAHSFVLPFIFCILLLVSHSRNIVEPSVMILPTVYLIIPLGTLFMTINQKSTSTTKDDVQVRAIFSPTKASHPDRGLTQTMTNSTNPSSSLTAFLSDPEAGNRPNATSPFAEVDRELAAIDLMDSSTIASLSQSYKGKEVMKNDNPRPDSCVLGPKGNATGLQLTCEVRTKQESERPRLDYSSSETQSKSVRSIIYRIQQESTSLNICTSATRVAKVTIFVLMEHDMSGDDIGQTPGKFGLHRSLKQALSTYCLQDDMMEELPGSKVCCLGMS
ncbi:hypothetical protein LTR84_002083 [Exophiala bonariae]|uniref:Uncharacterized protein n=1 Tax=Exophiala bonariae TaxID=1690606 RepID=A0AAV9NDY4_9EURO|nr:hypothetical protein LTR84_002083 [Exophiala bonariae]